MIASQVARKAFGVFSVGELIFFSEVVDVHTASLKRIQILCNARCHSTITRCS